MTAFVSMLAAYLNMSIGITTTPTMPIAHNPVTSHYVSGAVRFPVDLRLYRRYEELTQWETFVLKHFPATTLPKKKKARQKLHKQVDETLLQDPEFLERHNQFRTKMTWRLIWFARRSCTGSALLFCILIAGICRKPWWPKLRAAERSESAFSRKTAIWKPAVFN